jgi:hypothetical protein
MSAASLYVSWKGDASHYVPFSAGAWHSAKEGGNQKAQILFSHSYLLDVYTPKKPAYIFACRAQQCTVPAELHAIARRLVQWRLPLCRADASDEAAAASWAAVAMAVGGRPRLAGCAGGGGRWSVAALARNSAVGDKRWRAPGVHSR